MVQRLIQIGNSAGIIIPKSLLEFLDVNTGNEVDIDTDKTTKSLIIQNNKSVIKPSVIGPHFLKILDKVNQEYGSALRELALK